MLRDVTLGELIALRKRELGESYDQLSRRAKAAHMTLSDSTIHELATDARRAYTIKASTLDALAAALLVSREEVELAALESRNIHLPLELMARPDVLTYVAITEPLSEGGRRHMLSAIRAFSEALVDAD